MLFDLTIRHQTFRQPFVDKITGHAFPRDGVAVPLTIISGFSLKGNSLLGGIATFFAIGVWECIFKELVGFGL